MEFGRGRPGEALETLTALVDTSVIIRYLTGEPRPLSQRAAAIIDEFPLVVTDVVIAESAYVLQSVYRVPRPDIVDTLVDLLRKENITVRSLEKAIVIQALLLCRDSNRVSFADAMLWAAGRMDAQDVYSFDARFPEDGVIVRREVR